MKISTLISVAVVTTAQFSNAMPFAPQADNVTVSEDPFQWVTVRGAGHLQEQHLRKRDLLEKRNTNGRVTGVRVGYTGAYRIPRQEVRALYTNQGGRIFDLYILALRKLQARSKTDMNSYYQLAGIHGRPFTAWNGRGPGAPGSTLDGRYGGGYCTHGSTLFPTWHRPYLAYFEELVWANAQLVVNSEKNTAERAKWTEALNFLRIPYWDWTLQGGQLPWMLRGEKWTYTFYPNIYDKSKMPKSDNNPLYSYKFANGQYNDGSFPGQPWNYWAETKRAPGGGPFNPNTPSNIGAANSVLQSNAASRRQRVHMLLLQAKLWGPFSNRASTVSDSTDYDSLEAIHDGVHADVGSNGHMSYVEYSAFDPIFFLHHTMIDRLFAMWQAINYATADGSNFATRQTNQGGTYGMVPGTVDDINTHLEPFLGLSGQPYNSGATRDTSLFGYGYIEIPKHKISDKKKLSDYVKAQVEAIYGNTFAAAASSKKRDDSTAAIDEGINKSIINNNQYYEWKIDVAADKSALNGTYSIHFFLGRPSRDSSKWNTQPEHVGDYAIFTHTHQAAPGINPADINNNVTGSVPITEAMIKAFATLGLDSLKPADAITFLEKNLRWRITDITGKVHSVRSVKNLFVAVSVALSTLPTPETPWTEYGEWTHLTDIVRKIGSNGGPDQVGVIPVLSSSASSASVAPTTVATSSEAAAPTTTVATDVEVATTAAPTVDAVISTSADATATATSDASAATATDS